MSPSHQSLQAVALAAVVLTAGAAQAQVDVSPAVLYGAGPLPTAMAVGDLDGDAAADVAVVNQQGHLRTLFNDGGGCLTQVLERTGVWPLDVRPVDVAMGDLDGDGDNDLAVTIGENSGTVSILFNGGDGSFGLPVNLAACSYAKGVVIGDLDGDADSDLASTSNCFQASILLGDGQGSFTPNGRYGSGYTSSRIAAGDLDGDGVSDLVYVNIGISNVSVLLNDGTGAFPTHAFHTVGDNPHDVVIGDFDDDGDNDVATANFYGGNVSVLTNHGNGTFAGHRTFVAGAGPNGLATADFDGDGRLDLAVSNRDGNDLAVLRGLSGGGFSAAARFPVGTAPAAVGVTDFNRDARPDVAVLNPGNERVAVLFNDAATCPQPPPPPPTTVVIPLSARGFVGGKQRQVQLTWSDARGASVSLFRNGVKIQTLTNTGYHTDKVSQSGSYRYRVCEIAPFTSCSTEAVVTF